MNRKSGYSRRTVFFSPGGERISVEVDTGMIWVNARLAMEEAKEPGAAEISEQSLLRVSAEKNSSRRRMFGVTAPLSIVLFILSFSAHMLSPTTITLSVAALLSIAFIASVGACVFAHVTSGGRGELAHVRYRAQGHVSPADSPSPSSGYMDYIRNAPGYAMPVLSPRLYSILTCGSPLRSDLHRRPFTVATRGTHSV